MLLIKNWVHGIKGNNNILGLFFSIWRLFGSRIGPNFKYMITFGFKNRDMHCHAFCGKLENVMPWIIFPVSMWVRKEENKWITRQVSLITRPWASGSAIPCPKQSKNLLISVTIFPLPDLSRAGGQSWKSSWHQEWTSCNRTLTGQSRLHLSLRVAEHVIPTLTHLTSPVLGKCSFLSSLCVCTDHHRILSRFHISILSSPEGAALDVSLRRQGCVFVAFMCIVQPTCMQCWLCKGFWITMVVTWASVNIAHEQNRLLSSWDLAGTLSARSLHPVGPTLLPPAAPRRQD